MDWTAVASDAFKVQKNLNGGKKRGEADIAKIESGQGVFTDDGGVDYVQVESLPENGHAAAVQDLFSKNPDYSDVKKFKIPSLIDKSGNATIRDHRTLWGHYKFTLKPKSLFEFHASRFPTRGLGGLLAAPHIVFESAAFPLYNFRRNYLLPAFTFYSRNQAAFNAY